jgi:cytoskeletal protein CcmA (bactofilin family)
MPDPKSSASVAEKKTLVDEGTQFRGSLTSKCPIVVYGAVEGEVDAPSLTVAPSGAVRGNVRVRELRSQGELSGEFDAEAVVLAGTVKDKTVIRANTLEVKLAPTSSRLQVVFGECELQVGAAASKEEAIATSRSAVDNGGSIRPDAKIV